MKKSKLNNILSVISLVVLVLVIVGIEQFNLFGLNSYVIGVIKLCCIYAICALSMNIVNGLTGMFSLGQPGFMALGAYTTGLLTVSAQDKIEIYKIKPIVGWLANLNAPFFIALIAGGVVAGFAAFLIGFPVLRLKGDYLAIASLGFSEIIRIFIQNGQSVTNGTTGLIRIPGHVNLYVAFGILALVVIFMVLLINSSYGRAFKAIREDEIAAEAMGVNLFKHKMYSFIMSGFIAGIGGGLLASHLGAISPDVFKFTLAYEILLMVVLGGQGSISGSIVGAFIVRAALEWLRIVDNPIKLGPINYPGISGMRMVVFSVVLMFIILFWSRGIFGSEEFSFDRIFRFFKSKKSAKEAE
ncbi:MAG: branched-chain amino acid ABC transporter permease [Clostridiales bacterium]|nr:branched-chain amino acid ABC transporter permease [Clostridiales bacterium]